MKMYRERITGLEADLAKSRGDMTDFAYEVKRLSAEKQRMQE